MDGDALSFRIDSISSGALNKWSGSLWQPVTPGTTLLATGEKIQWQPAPNANGTLNAFSISAYDGSLASASPLLVQVAVNSPNFAVDTERPTLSTAITISNTALKIGDTATVTFSFTEAVTDFTTADLMAPNASLSNLSSRDIGINWTATLTPTATTTAASNVITLDYEGMTDLAGNSGSGSTKSGNYSVDSAAASVVAVRSTTANGTYGVGEIITLQVQFSEGLVISGSPKLQLETGRIDQFATFTGLDKTATANDTLTFTYTVQVGDSAEDLDQGSLNALDLDGGTLKDAAGNDAILTLGLPGTAGSLTTNASLIIDTNRGDTDNETQSAVTTFGLSTGKNSSLVTKSIVFNQQTDPVTGETVVANTLLFFDNATNDSKALSGLQLGIGTTNPGTATTVISTSDLISFTVKPTMTTSGQVSSIDLTKVRNSAIEAFETTIHEVDLLFPQDPGGGWNALYKKNKDGEYYLFNYDVLTGLGGILLDRDNDGSIDGARLYLKDGELGDFDEAVNGRIDDPIGFTTLSTTPTLRMSRDGKGLTVEGVAGTGLWISLAVTSFSSSSQSNLEMYNNDQPLGAIGATLGDPTGSQAIYMAAGSTLSFRSSVGSGQGNSTHALSISSTPTGYSMGLDADRNGTYTDFMLDISSSIAASSPASLAIARKQLASSDAILDLTSIAATGLTLTLDISTDCSLHNRFGFVKLDPLTGTTYLVNGVSQADGADGANFRREILAQFIDPYQGSGKTHRFGQSRQTISWALDSSAAGFYAPVIITQGGEVFTFGASTASDGHQHVKLLGTNTFGFEDLLASQGSDWDFNDTKIRVSVT